MARSEYIKAMAEELLLWAKRKNRMTELIEEGSKDEVIVEKEARYLSGLKYNLSIMDKDIRNDVMQEIDEILQTNESVVTDQLVERVNLRETIDACLTVKAVNLEVEENTVEQSNPNGLNQIERRDDILLDEENYSGADDSTM